MIVKIYDANDNPTEFDMSIPLVRWITVAVIDGDESVRVFYYNGRVEDFYSTKFAHLKTSDHLYHVDNDKLESWVKFDKWDGTKSYCRMKAFYNHEVKTKGTK